MNKSFCVRQSITNKAQSPFQKDDEKLFFGAEREMTVTRDLFVKFFGVMRVDSRGRNSISQNYIKGKAGASERRRFKAD